MKKNIIKSLCIIFIILIVASVIIFVKYKELQEQKRVVEKFNSEYEIYNKDELNGLDITTVINKAISNNEKYEITKDDEGLYNLDDENCIEIYVKMIINDTTYRMERINNLGIQSFISYFGEVHFNCIDVQYHEQTGKIASMTFEATEY
jgi:hypothetical protein